MSNLKSSPSYSLNSLNSFFSVLLHCRPSVAAFFAAFFPAALCAAAFAFPCAVSAKPDAAHIATIGSMSGDFEYRPAGDEKYRAVERDAAASMKIYDRDALKTPEGVAGTVETTCGARIELKEKTEIEFGVFSVRIKKGDMWVNYKRRGDGGAADNFKVLTPAGTIGIKGTEFRTVVMEGGGEVRIIVTEGAVSFTNAAGEAKTIEAGFGLTIDAAGKSGEPVKFEGGGTGDGVNAPGARRGEKNDGNSEKNGEKKTDAGHENEKPLQIEDGKDVNNEANPFD